MTGLADELVPRFPHGVRFREDKTRGRHILVGPERIFEADGVATEILKRVDGRRRLDEIVADLAANFAADVSVIRPDVEGFLSELEEKQLVVL
ncbi:pyrroloquinoline quinone biosynthesis peptide chaperone PqqD [Aureimonas altamirensis]|nr:pyrroloquinoline quinone biosynthesis peptide chaperone PqqD [Aureimonas altamirensis]MCM2503330.1 pyrroloquinoline quinone biosynthesis peptide chaperone PqqD [Aureimonas altamirensis]